MSDGSIEINEIPPTTEEENNLVEKSIDGR